MDFKNMRIECIEMDRIDEFLSIIREIAIWLKENNKEMWRLEKLNADRFKEKHKDALYHLCYVGDEPAAAFMIKEENPKFWPEVPEGETLFLKTLGVRRPYAGTGLSTAIMNWVKDEARKRNKRFVRLEIFSTIQFLNTFYQQHGFKEVRVIKMDNGYQVGLYQYQL